MDRAEPMEEMEKKRKTKDQQIKNELGETEEKEVGGNTKRDDNTTKNGKKNKK